MDNGIIRPGGGEYPADTAGEPLIRLRGIEKRYNDKHGEVIEILSGADFDVFQGQSIAVVGESGIGKTTFLHILGTLDRPDAGAYLFKGIDILSMDDKQLARFRNRSMGFVFQFHYLLPEFSALENVMMPARIAGIPFHEAREQAELELERMGLLSRMDHRVTDLSGGEQQRVALARALVMKPEILLADEPTGNLDERNSLRIHEYLEELNRDAKMTLVCVTHSQHLASRMQRCFTIKDGKLVEIT